MHFSCYHTDILVTKKAFCFSLIVENLRNFQDEMRRIAKRFLRYMRGPFLCICISGFSQDLQR